MALLRAAVDRETALRVALHVEGAAAGHEVDADADIRGEEELAGLPDGFGSRRIVFGAGLREALGDFGRPLSVGRIGFEEMPEFGLVPVRNVFDDVGSSAGERKSSSISRPNPVAVVLAERRSYSYLIDSLWAEMITSFSAGASLGAPEAGRRKNGMASRTKIGSAATRIFLSMIGLSFTASGSGGRPENGAGSSGRASAPEERFRSR